MEHPAIAEEAFVTLTVESTTLDYLVDTYSLDPGFVKIDVEGMEHVVVAGMQSVLANKRPVLLLEVVDPLLRKNGSSLDEVMRLIEKHEYDVIDPFTERPVTPKSRIGEILCLPKRKRTA